MNKAFQSSSDKHVAVAERWKQTLQAIESVKAGKTVDADSMHKWMNSWGQKKEKKPPTL